MITEAISYALHVLAWVGIAIGIVALLYVAAAVLVMTWPQLMRLRRWQLTRTRQRRDDAARWEPYCLTDPETGDWLIGFWLITPDGRCLDDIRIEHVPETDEARRQEMETAAVVRAGRANIDRTPKQVRMWRLWWIAWDVDLKPEPVTRPVTKKRKKKRKK